MREMKSTRDRAGGERRVTQIVAIDGPAGAGKSSVARQVARRLGMAFLDTGAMYRAATWWAMHRGVDLDDAEGLVASTRAMPLEMEYRGEDMRIWVDGADVTEAIRTPAVTNNIRKLDGIAGVREPLVGRQRAIAAARPTVAEGRDVGTVVFPEARCKIYLDASLEERIRRRAEQQRQKGLPADLAALREEIVRRDENDRRREVAPLKKAEDACVLDTTSMTLEEVVDEIVERARACL